MAPQHKKICIYFSYIALYQLLILLNLKYLFSKGFQDTNA